MKTRSLLILMLAVSLVPATGITRPVQNDSVDVRIVSDNGAEFQRYRTYPNVSQPGSYFYMEAVKGQKYSITVTNRSNRRVGVVIAVDGRNIISGKKSYLNNNERMYLIEPYATNTFNGWRTGMDRTNRFYFTEQSDSYAEKVFADASAMGTIAVVVYREKIHEVAPYTPSCDDFKSESKDAGAKRYSRNRGMDESSEQAGTGFGETAYSPVREVPFEPEIVMSGKVVLKYEWRSALCRKGVVNCTPANRLWPFDNNGFAPVPRDFRE